MRLLFDEHLSPKLVRRLADIFPGSAHVHGLGLRGSKDRSIWEVARANGFVLVSRDSDFEHLAMTLGAPPRVVLIRAQDGRTTVIEAVLRRRATDIESFGRDSNASLLILE